MPTPQGLRLAFAPTKKEGSYGVQIASTDFTVWFEPNDAEVSAIDIQYRTDAKHIKLYRGETARQEKRRKGARTYKFDLSTEVFTMLMALGSGNVTAAGIADPWTQTIKEGDVNSNVIVSFGHVEGYPTATATYLLYKGEVVSKIDFEIKGENEIESSVTTITDGSETAVPTFAWPAASLAVNYLLGTMATLKLGPLGTEDITASVARAKYSFDFAPTMPDRVGSGTLVKTVKRGANYGNLAIEIELEGDKSHVIYGYENVAVTTPPTAPTSLIHNLTIDPGVTPSRSVQILCSKCVATVKQKADGTENRLTAEIIPQGNSTDGGRWQVVTKVGTAAYLINSP